VDRGTAEIVSFRLVDVRRSDVVFEDCSVFVGIKTAFETSLCKYAA